MIGKEEKQNVINDFKLHETDTGSVETQIAVLTKRIENLKKHFDAHRQDTGSKRGLMKMVNRRRKFLEYVKRRNEDAYKNLIGRLGLRK